MGLAIAGVLANLFGIYLVYQEAYYEPVYLTLFYIMSAFWLLSVLGLLIAIGKQYKVGGILIIIGSIIFVPLGLIAVFGARKIMQPLDSSDLAARRAAISSHKNS